MDPPGLLKAHLFQLRTLLRVFAKLMSLLVVALTDELDGTPTIFQVPVESKDFADHSFPRSIHQPSQWLELVRFVHVMTIDVPRGDVATAARGVTDELFQFVESRNIPLSVSLDLPRHLGGAGILVFFAHLELFFVDFEEAYSVPQFLVPADPPAGFCVSGTNHGVKLAQVDMLNPHKRPTDHLADPKRILPS